MLIEKISKDERDIINCLREEYSNPSDSDFFNGSFVDCDTFLRYWSSAKTPMEKAFGDGLIVKTPIVTTIEDDELHGDMSRLFYTSEYTRVKNKIYETYSGLNRDEWDSRCVRDSAGIYYSFYELFRYWIFNESSWAENKYAGPTFEVVMPNGSRNKIASGCKVMKALGRLVKALDDESISEDFETLRLRQSQILNDARINAELCISIHPLDFMTASYNSNNWRSCMCWTDGEYRRGVVEMMNSPMVVVAYIESHKESLNFYCGRPREDKTWNSKRWREFFIVTPNVISGIKGYPYWNRGLEDAALKKLREMFGPIFGVNYSESIINWTADSECVESSRGDIYCRPHFECGPAMYNDFYGNNEYHTIFVENYHGEDERGNFWIDYSGPSECVCCGDVENEFDGEGELICTDCVTHYVCCKCGDEIYSEDDLISFHDRYYCRDCFENLDTCDSCGKMIDLDNDEDCMDFAVGLNDVTHTKVMRRKNNIVSCFSVCPDCAEKIFTNGTREVTHFTHFHFSDWNHWLPIVPHNRLSKAGRKFVGVKDLERFISFYANENTGEKNSD